MKQLVLIAILVCALELPLSLWERRIESTSDPSVFVTHTGLPFESIRITNNVTYEQGVAWYSTRERSKYSGRFTVLGDPHHQLPFSVKKSSEYLWSGIILNTILLTVFSIITVKLATRIRDEIEYRRYYKP
jgi:hypothetical protein